MRALDGDGQVGIELAATVPPGTTADFTVRVVMQVEAEWSAF